MKILFTSDDLSFWQSAILYLKHESHIVHQADSLKLAQAETRDNDYDCIVCGPFKQANVVKFVNQLHDKKVLVYGHDLPKPSLQQFVEKIHELTAE